MAATLHGQYPAATLQDVYKTCYQGFWGAEHAAPDSARAAAYLDSELQLMQNETRDESNMPMQERCGWRRKGRYERMSLWTVVDSTITKEKLLRDFLAAAQKSPAHNRRTDRRWYQEWILVETEALKAVPAWQNESLQQELMAAAKRAQPVHHSEGFRNNYHPHYRVLRTSK